MYFYSYTKIWFEKLLDVATKGHWPVNETFFVFVLMHELNTELHSYLEEHYSNLNLASGSALQIFAPIKPPKSILLDLFGPEFPLDHHEERQAFFRSVRDAGLDPRVLPQLVFFSVTEVKKGKYELSDLRTMSLRPIEFGSTNFLSYREFFSELVAIAQSTRAADGDHNQFYRAVELRFRVELMEEGLRQVPILGTLYTKYIGS